MGLAAARRGGRRDRLWGQISCAGSLWRAGARRRLRPLRRKGAGPAAEGRVRMTRRIRLQRRVEHHKPRSSWVRAAGGLRARSVVPSAKQRVRCSMDGSLGSIGERSSRVAQSLSMLCRRGVAEHAIRRIAGVLQHCRKFAVSWRRRAEQQRSRGSRSDSGRVKSLRTQPLARRRRMKLLLSAAAAFAAVECRLTAHNLRE